MKAFFWTLFIYSCFSTIVLRAQPFRTGLGIRAGGLASGITLKHFATSSTALEGILGLGYRSFIITGLIEKHVPINNSSNFLFEYGAGAHVGFFNDNGGYYYHRNNYAYNATTVVGIDGILGIEYKFKQIPLNIGMDFKPFVDLFSGGGLYFEGAFNFRYTF